MKNIHLLRHYIREAIDLGKTQFSPERLDDVDKTEINTPEEQELYNQLIRRIRAGRHLTQPTADIILDLLDSKYGSGGSGFFSEPPSDQPLYRGHVFSEKWIRDHIPEEFQTNIISNYKFIGMNKIRKDMTTQITGNGLIQLTRPYMFEQLRGWSKNFNNAIDFAMEYSVSGDQFPPMGSFQSEVKEAIIPVVLVTTPGQQPGGKKRTRFLDFESSMYKTRRGQSYGNEEECVNLGTVTVTHVAIAGLDSDLGVD